MKIQKTRLNKNRSKSVTVPLVVPFSTMLAPGTTSPLLSLTTPDTDVCAKAIPTVQNNNKLKMCFFRFIYIINNKV